MFDVMLDLETMGNGPLAAIAAIGAVEFDTDTGAIGRKFYAPVSLESSVAAGGVIDASTVVWWMQQDLAARKLFSEKGQNIAEALQAFSTWVAQCGDADDVHVWGNGAAFDNVILASAYRRLSLSLPWRFWNDRCYRTMRDQFPGVELQRVGTYHNAVDDAESQARHMLAMFAPRVAKAA